MAFTQIFAATVAVQYGWAGIGAQRLDERDVRQTTAMVRAELPAQKDYLENFVLKDRRNKC